MKIKRTSCENYMKAILTMDDHFFCTLLRRAGILRGAPMSAIAFFTA